MGRTVAVLLMMSWAADVPAALPTLDLKLVADQLSNVTVIAHAGDGSGRLFVAQQNGLIKVVVGTNVLATPFLNISSLLLNSGEQGLLGLAFDPNYATNGYFYVYYTHTSGNSNIVARFTASPPSTNVASTATRAEVISLTHTNFSNHNGGCIQFGPDGYLYIATGDGGGSCDPFRNSQNLNSPLGKLLRLNVTNGLPYSVPSDNPFVGAPGLDEIWAYGLRNPWRFSFDRTTGDLFIGDVGQGPTNPREEVDFQTAGSAGGQNYGWPHYEGFLTNTCSLAATNFPHTLPILDYDHSGSRIAITGGYRYRGAAIPPLAGAYLFADEKSSGPLYGATQSIAGVWSFGLLTNTPYTITTFGEDESGELYLSRYANNTAGGIYKIVWKDTDNDGMPDDFETAFGLNPANAADATQDADGDGMTNLAEFQAGTDPTNSVSFLRITATGPAGADWLVTFSTVSNKLYRLERSDDLTTTNWLTVTNNLAGTGNPIAVTDPGGATATNRFYRIRLLP
jgi:glucose/arabinose dehydrogenase